MRKLFFFRSSSSNNGAGSPASLANKGYRENLSESSDIDDGCKKQCNNQSTKDLRSMPKKLKTTGTSGLRRSFSFSSRTTYSDPGEHSLKLNDPTSSPSTSGNGLSEDLGYPISHRALTPERIPKSRRCDQMASLKIAEKLNSPPSSKLFADSSGNSPCSSPLPLKCRAPCLTQVSDKVLDRYIDGEQERNFEPQTHYSRRNSPQLRKSGHLEENGVLPNSRRPPRSQTSRPTTPTKRQTLRSYSFREVSNRDPHYLRDLPRDDVCPTSPRRLARFDAERLSEAVTQDCRLKSKEYDAETTSTFVEIFEDCPEIQASVNPNFSLHQNALPLDALNAATSRYCAKGKSAFVKQAISCGDDPTILGHDCFGLERVEQTDMELQRKAKEVEDQFNCLTEEFEDGKLTIRNILNGLRNLNVEVSNQIQNRIAERSCAREALKIAKTELDSRTRRLEREKNELQSSLEKELDRRSKDWSFKLEKYQSEEQRLRDRVRELAEQNVSLQRELSSFKSRDAEAKRSIVDLESQLNDVTSKMEEMETENAKLQRAVAELQDRSEGAESDRDYIKRSYKEKDKEMKDLQKAVVRLQKICSDQEKTISGLQHGIADETNKQSSDKGDASKLQLELMRLVGVEHNLRKEIDYFRAEVDSLRHENVSLLDRLNGGRLSSFKLEEELHTHLQYLQNQCFSLLEEGSHICAKLLELVKVHHNDEGMQKEQDVRYRLDGYSVLEYDMKLQSFKKGVENLRRGLQTLSSILQEKAELCTSEVPQKGSRSRAIEEGDVEYELKAENLLTKALREKLLLQELEIEQLRADLATSVRGNDILKCQVQRVQDEVSSLTHKMKDAELQMLRKDENINELQMDLDLNLKELMAIQGILPKVSKERDLMWEEVKQYSEKNMLLNHEMVTLKKKIEALDEDLLFKEGQITILKDSLNKKTFDVLYDPNSAKDFIL